MKKNLALLTGLLASLAGSAQAVVLLSEDFDGGGINSVYNFTSNGGTPPALVDAGGSHGDVARITSLTASNNNTIAWDVVNVTSTPVLRMSFDFAITDDATNNGNGGCCGQAADGFGIGFFPTAAFGATGGVNPAVGPVAFNWEDGLVVGYPALILGFDVFDANNISVSWNGTSLGDDAAVNPINDNNFHSVIVTITDMGSDSLIDLSLDGDAFYTGLLATGVDLDAIGTNFRLVAGGRTGSAFANTDLDNVLIEAVPEPGTGMLGVAALAGLTLRRRRKA